ncbi:hypothetical protein HNQ91_004015 [Filimonas zeae]|nr:sialate O-acetylesterase [Filimonas zeae]MDR6340942.1 hypothetical protein [Filimonas zeae]
MKILPLMAVLLFFVATHAQQPKPDSNFHVYLLIGQSNMAGRGPLDSLSKQVHPQVVMLDSFNKWIPATDPVHFDKPAAVGVGPARSFAESMLTETTGKAVKIGLVPCAWGGSPVKVWEPGAVYLKQFYPYDFAIERLRIAMQHGVIKGILWHQGESDNDSAHAAVYLNKLAILIGRLRAETQQADLPFVAGEIGYFNKKELVINSVINQLPQQLRGTAVISAKGLTDKGDRLHFDAASARELGKRYAAAMKALQAKRGS